MEEENRESLELESEPKIQFYEDCSDKPAWVSQGRTRTDWEVKDSYI